MSKRCSETNRGGQGAPFIVGYVYLLRSFNEEYGKVYKIGITKNKVAERLSNLQTGNPNSIEVVYIYECKIKPSKLESRLHRRFKYCLVSGEWYNLTDEDVKEFPQTCEFFERILIQTEKPPY